MAIAVQVIRAHRGRVVVTGERRCDEVARRLAAALSAAGACAWFLSPLLIARGELGEYRPGDVMVMVSEGQTSAEMLALAALARAAASPVIAITDTASSRLAKEADLVLAAEIRLEDSQQSAVLGAMSDAFVYGVRHAGAQSSYGRSYQYAH
jgi:D-arabinose 5-phosphate isomerase GutQ